MSSDKHSLSKVQEPSLYILPTSSSWVLYSGRWAAACSPDREPAHSCHSGPQGLAASDLYKVAKLLTLQAASRASSPLHVLVYGPFPWSSSVRILSGS